MYFQSHHLTVFEENNVFIVIQFEFACHADNLNCHSLKSVHALFIPMCSLIDRCQPVTGT